MLPRRYRWLDLLAGALLRLAPPPLGAAWRHDARLTVRAVCADAYDTRGWPGLIGTGCREIVGLAAAAIRARTGRLPALTAGRPARSSLERTPLMFIDDLRHGWRRVTGRPGAALLSVTMLGVGIGLATAMFTLVDALLLRPVPFRDPDRIARVSTRSERGGRLVVSPAILDAWKRSGIFESVEGASALGASASAIVDVGGEPLLRGAARVSPGMFDLLGVAPVRGRGFGPEDGRAGTEDRVILSETVWRSLYHADPRLIGQSIQIDGRPHLVVGLMPADFRFPRWDTVIWRPLDYMAPPAPLRSELPAAYVRWAAHLPAVDVAARATAVLRATDPAMAALRASLDPLVTSNRDEYYKRAVPTLAAGVGLVFLVLCANVSGLLLAQFTTRRREYAMCSALGASRARLMREAAAESAVLGAAGVAAGLGVAWALVALSRGFLPDAFLLRSLNPVNLDVRALAAASAIGILATILAGALPAWIGTAVSATGSLRATERGGTETRTARLASRTLLVGEIALACTLLVGATLLVRSFINLSGTDRGLRTRDIMTAWVSLPATLTDTASRRIMATELEGALQSMPGVQRVALSFGLPPDGGAIHFSDTWRSDIPESAPLDLIVESYDVRPDFFAIYDIPILRGRTFEPGDPATATIVGERLAGAFWPGQDPVGRTFTFDRRSFQVVGLAREIHLPTLETQSDLPEFYKPLREGGGSVMLSVRCQPCPSIPAIRRRIESLRGGVRIQNVGRLEDLYTAQLARPRAAAALGGVFAIIAVAAAAGGLLSVLTYAVSRRRREFGIRAALGASASHLRRVVLRDSLLVTGMGLAIGGVAAWALGRALASMSYGVTPADPLTWIVVIATIGGAALAAAWRPARQAVRADPVTLLREE